jgi:hypothetical protein
MLLNSVLLKPQPLTPGQRQAFEWLCRTVFSKLRGSSAVSLSGNKQGVMMSLMIRAQTLTLWRVKPTFTDGMHISAWSDVTVVAVTHTLMLRERFVWPHDLVQRISFAAGWCCCDSQNVSTQDDILKTNVRSGSSGTDAVDPHYVLVPHATTRLPLDGFPWNLIFEYFSKICREPSILITIPQE